MGHNLKDVINPCILRICIEDMLLWLQKMETLGFELFFLEINGQIVVDLNTKNGMLKYIL